MRSGLKYRRRGKAGLSSQLGSATGTTLRFGCRADWAARSRTALSGVLVTGLVVGGRARAESGGSGLSGRSAGSGEAARSHRDA